MFPITPRIDGTDIGAASYDIERAIAGLYDAEPVTLAFTSSREDTGGNLCSQCGEPIESTSTAPYWRHTDPEHEHAPAYCRDALEHLACRVCDEDIEPGPGGWVHVDDTPTGGHEAEPDAEDLTERPTASPAPLDWLNSARVTIDPDEDAVHMAVSTGDPRGAHVFTVRRVQPDDGPPAIILHTPHPGDAGPHTGLEPLHPGTFREAPYPSGADLRPVWLTDDERDALIARTEEAPPGSQDLYNALAKIRRA